MPRAVRARTGCARRRGRRDAGRGPSHDGEWDAAWSVPQRGSRALVLLAPGGRRRPVGSLASYEAHGGYDALRKAIEIGASAVVDEVTRSGLVGRGGAAFPDRPQVAGGRGARIDAALPRRQRRRERARHVQGSSGDRERSVLDRRGDDDRRLRHRLRAGLPLPARRVPASRGSGWRQRSTPHERPATWATTFSGAAFASTSRCARARARTSAVRRPRCSTRSRDIAVSRASKPPFPVDVGLFGQPTVANNVETLVNVLPIVLDGGDAFARTGSGMSTGTKLFCVSGHVGRPGVYEVPFGPTLREVIDLAGGVAGTGRLQAVLLGGVAGRFVGPEALDAPLTFEGTRAIGASLGSGVILPLDDTVDLRPLLVRIAGFFRHESCGQCVPCRVGTVRQQEALVRMTTGGDAPARARTARRGGAVHARRLDLRSRPDRVRRDRLRAAEVRAVRIHRGGRCLTSTSTAARSRSPPGATLLDACRAERRRRANDVLRRDAASEERVPHLRGRARRQSSARAGMLAAGRGRHGRAHADRSHLACPQARARAARVDG